MKTLETTATVDKDGIIKLSVPDIEPGKYHLLLVIDDNPTGQTKKKKLELKVMESVELADNISLRREDIYEY